jgi:hypothetical protein
VSNQTTTPLQTLRTQLLQRWRQFPPERLDELDAELDAALTQAQAAKPEMLTVMNPVSRPLRLRLAVLVSDRDLDPLYRLEWAELAVSDRGRCYLVYRRRDGGDYAIEWSPSTTLPASMADDLSDVLALALLEDDGDGDGNEAV